MAANDRSAWSSAVKATVQFPSIASTIAVAWVARPKKNRLPYSVAEPLASCAKCRPAFTSPFFAYAIAVVVKVAQALPFAFVLEAPLPIAERQACERERFICEHRVGARLRGLRHPKALLRGVQRRVKLLTVPVQ